MEPDRRRRGPQREGVRLAVAGVLGAVVLLGITTGCAAVSGQGVVAAGVNLPAVTTASVAPTTVAPTTITQTMTYTATVTPEADDPAGDPSDSADAPSATGSGDLYQDTAAAVSFTEGFWNDTFTGWDVVWHGPSLWAGNGFYDSEVRDRPGAEWWTEGPPCAGERADEDNAFFCTTGEVAWDHTLMDAGYADFGHSFVYVLVAHEWAHAAQQRFIADGEAPAVLAQQELQADCLAGTTIAGAVKLGYVELEIGDTARLTDTLAAMGDETAWRTSDDHGSAQERVSWFTTGFNEGIEACLGNA